MRFEFLNTSRVFEKSLVIMLLITLNSCQEVGVFRKPKWVGVITNETPKTIQIYAYSKSIKEYSIEIEPHKDFVISLSESELGFSEGIFYKQRESPPQDLIDSVEIVFNGNKKLLQYCDGNALVSCESTPKNLVNLWIDKNQITNKKGNLLFGYLYKYKIAFSIDDYKRASASTYFLNPEQGDDKPL